MTENAGAGQMTAPRDIVITNRSLEYGNIESWINIIESYSRSHPEHEVIIFYEGEEVSNMISLFKLHDQPNLNGFQLVVRAPDGNWKDVAKLYRFMVEGASARFHRFIGKEMYQVLNLF